MASDSSPSSKKVLPFIIIAAVFVSALLAGVWLFNSSSRQSKVDPGEFGYSDNSSSARPVAPAPAPAPGAQPAHVRGEPGALVTIEEFGDFECPPCAALHPQLKKIESEYGSRLRVIFRNLPLPMHKHATEAARAAEAAGRQGRFWQMHDKIYEAQNIWKNEPDVRIRFVEYAASLGLNVDQFKRDMDSMEVATRIAADLARANSLNITGTPTLLLDGRQVRTEAYLGATANLRAEIDSAIAAKGK